MTTSIAVLDREASVADSYVDAYSFVVESVDDNEDEDSIDEDEYSWNRYTQSFDEDDWDQQDGTWGPVGYVDSDDSYSDTYVDHDDYEYSQLY